MASLKKYKHIPKALMSALALPFTYGIRNIEHAAKKTPYPEASSKSKKYSANKIFNGFVKNASGITGSLGGLVTGAILGTYLIPVPILGTLIGAALGLVGGTLIGHSIGSKLNAKNLRTYFTQLALVIGGAAGMWKGGVIGAFIGQTVIPIPGVGSAIGFVVGAFAGLFIVGGLASSIVSFATKHISRLVTAAFNFDEVNPTNPNKYRVAPRSSVVNPTIADYEVTTNLLSKTPQGQAIERKDLLSRNELLADCAKQRDTIVGGRFGHYFLPKMFLTEEQLAAKAKLNSHIATLHDFNADIGDVDGLRREIAEITPKAVVGHTP